MGFDGMDPTLARQFMDAGKVPDLKRLADSGSFAKLETTQPSESPSPGGGGTGLAVRYIGLGN